MTLECVKVMDRAIDELRQAREEAETKLHDCSKHKKFLLFIIDGKEVGQYGTADLFSQAKIVHVVLDGPQFAAARFISDLVKLNQEWLNRTIKDVMTYLKLQMEEQG